MYLTVSQTRASTDNLKKTAIQVCIDALDGMTEQLFIETFNSKYKSLERSFNWFKRQLYSVVCNTEYLVGSIDDPLYTVTFVNIAFNYAVDFTKDKKFHEFLDMVGPTYIPRSDYESLVAFIKSCELKD